MSILPRLSLTCTIAGLLLAGCAHQPTTQNTPKTAASPATAAAGSRTAYPHHPAASQGHITVQGVELPDHTGIPACDDYLSSYLACHRAAAIFPPDQLEYRYQQMRTNLLIDSQNPDIRPQLAARCNSLAASLRDALHGKSCAVNPASASSAP